MYFLGESHDKNIFSLFSASIKTKIIDEVPIFTVLHIILHLQKQILL